MNRKKRKYKKNLKDCNEQIVKYCRELEEAMRQAETYEVSLSEKTQEAHQLKTEVVTLKQKCDSFERGLESKRLELNKSTGKVEELQHQLFERAEST